MLAIFSQARTQTHTHRQNTQEVTAIETEHVTKNWIGAQIRHKFMYFLICVQMRCKSNYFIKLVFIMPIYLFL